MNRIYFDKVTRKKEAFFVLIGLIAAIASIIQYSLDFKSKWVLALVLLVAILSMEKLVKMLMHRYYVTWTKYSINIKLNRWSSKGILFRKIKSVELQDRQLKLLRKDAESLDFDLSRIDQRDIDRLKEIFISKGLSVELLDAEGLKLKELTKIKY